MCLKFQILLHIFAWNHFAPHLDADFWRIVVQVGHQGGADHLVILGVFLHRGGDPVRNRRDDALGQQNPEKRSDQRIGDHRT